MISAYGVLTNALRRVLDTLGLKRVPRDVTPQVERERDDATGREPGDDRPGSKRNFELDFSANLAGRSNRCSIKDVLVAAHDPMKGGSKCFAYQQKFAV